MKDISRGARRCLDLLRWYARRFTQVYPSQEKLAARLKVSDRQVRSYLSELRKFGLISIHQGGDGHTASYTLTSGLTSGLLPGCFRAEIEGSDSEGAPDQELTGKNFRAESSQLSSSGSDSSYQSESTVEESSATEPTGNDFEQAQLEAIFSHARACGIEPTPELVLELRRKGKHHGVSGFAVAAAIERAWRKVRGTSNAPRGPSWFTAVVEAELRDRAVPEPVPKKPPEPAQDAFPIDHAVLANFDSQIQQLAGMRRLR